MASRRNRTINMPAPYLRQVWLETERIVDRAAYPYCLPLFQENFELDFDRADHDHRWRKRHGEINPA